MDVYAATQWRVVDQGVIKGSRFTLGPDRGHQSIRRRIGATRGSVVSIELKLEMLNIGTDFSLYIAAGKHQLILIDHKGNVIPGSASEWLVRHQNESSVIKLEYISASDDIIIGVRASHSLTCQGTNGAAFSVSGFEITSIKPLVKQYDFQLNVLDVGARGGLQTPWEKLYLSRDVTPVFIEPEPVAAQALREIYPESIVVEEGLSDQFGSASLFVTAVPGCSSLLAPDHAVLARYKNMKNFRVVNTETVVTRPYRAIRKEFNLPDIDFAKIDVQGLEYEVIQGMVGAMDSLLVIELEAQFYPVYRDQKLIGDIVALLDGLGFGLHAIRRMGAFEEMVEANVWFVRRGRLGPAMTAKMTAIREVLKLK